MSTDDHAQERERVAFAIWNCSNPEPVRASLTLEKVSEEDVHVDCGDGITHMVSLDWKLNRDSYLQLADAAIAAIDRVRAQ